MDWFFPALHIWMILAKASSMILIVMLAAGFAWNCLLEAVRPNAFLYRALHAVFFVAVVFGGFVAVAIATLIPPQF